MIQLGIRFFLSIISSTVEHQMLLTCLAAQKSYTCLHIEDKGFLFGLDNKAWCPSRLVGRIVLRVHVSLLFLWLEIIKQLFVLNVCIVSNNKLRSVSVVCIKFSKLKGGNFCNDAQVNMDYL